MFDLWCCAWAKLPRFPPHCPGQEQGRSGGIVHSASGWCHIFEWRCDSAGATLTEPTTGLEGLQEKVKAVELLMAENSSCLEQRRLVLENWTAINQEPVFIVDPSGLHFVHEEHQKGHRTCGQETTHQAVSPLYGFSVEWLGSSQQPLRFCPHPRNVSHHSSPLYIIVLLI